MYISFRKKAKPEPLTQNIYRSFLWFPIIFNKRFYWLEYVRIFKIYKHWNCKFRWDIEKIQVLKDDLSVEFEDEMKFAFSEPTRWNEN